MVLIKDNVKDFLLTLSLEEIIHNGWIGQSAEIESDLEKLDTDIKSIYATTDETLPAYWRRYGYFVYKNRPYAIAYLKRNYSGETIVTIESVAKRDGNRWVLLNESLITSRGNKLFEHLDFYSKREFISNMIIFED